MAPDEAGQFSLAEVCEGNTAVLEGDALVTQAGATPDAAVVKLVLLALHPVAAPAAFFGTTYQLYTDELVRPVAL